MKIKYIIFALSFLFSANSNAVGKLLYEKTDWFGQYGNSLVQARDGLYYQIGDWCSKSWVSCDYFDINMARCGMPSSLWVCELPVHFKVYQAN